MKTGESTSRSRLHLITFRFSRTRTSSDRRPRQSAFRRCGRKRSGAVSGGNSRPGRSTPSINHPPAPPGMKKAADFFAIWGGISGCQHGFELVPLSEALSRMAPERALPLLATRFSENVARRFRLSRTKGSLAEGLDADMTIIDTRGEHTLSNSELLYRHRQGPYDGRKTHVRISRTIVRGHTVYAQGRIAPGAPSGHFVHPA